MNKALVQNAEHDIHRHHRRDNQPDSAAQRRLESEGAALELRGDIHRQIQRLFGVHNRLHRIAQRIVIRHVKGDGRYRELIQMVDGERRKTLLNFGN